MDLVNEFHRGQDSPTKLFLMEFALHGLAEYRLISKNTLTSGLQFKDLLSGMFTLPKPGQEDDDDEEEDEEEEDDENEDDEEDGDEEDDEDEY